MIQGATTAIKRKSPPEPLRWLYTRKLIRGRSLDYGSGRDCWYKMECYDPHWQPRRPVGKFDTITCVYVLNVVTEPTQKKILAEIKSLLSPGGTAYFAVRRDLPRTGRSGRGVYQRYVLLGLPSIRRTSGHEIYVLRRSR